MKKLSLVLILALVLCAMPIAAHAEKLLDEYYGDWMTPPPGNARRAHYPDILDFGPYA